jgi:hypothetical protein
MIIYIVLRTKMLGISFYEQSDRCGCQSLNIITSITKVAKMLITN